MATRLPITRLSKGEDIPALNALTEVLAELVGVQRGAHEHDLQVVPVAQQVLDDGKEDVRVQAAFVDLIQNQVTDAGQTPEAQEDTTAGCVFKKEKKLLLLFLLQRKTT